MIVVKIPAALAGLPPTVVPVQAAPTPGHPEDIDWLVGQRVALAWRETRMVVGWTAEVEAVAPIVGNRMVPAPYVRSFAGELLLVQAKAQYPVTDLRPLLPLARVEWTSLPFALVLRDAERYPQPVEDPSCWACSGEQCWKCGAGVTPDPTRPRCEHDVVDRHNGERCSDLDPVPCEPFDGYAALEDVVE